MDVDIKDDVFIAKLHKKENRYNTLTLGVGFQKTISLGKFLRKLLEVLLNMILAEG